MKTSSDLNIFKICMYFDIFNALFLNAFILAKSSYSRQTENTACTNGHLITCDHLCCLCTPGPFFCICAFLSFFVNNTAMIDHKIVKLGGLKVRLDEATVTPMLNRPHILLSIEIRDTLYSNVPHSRKDRLLF